MLRSVDEIGANKTINPHSETQRRQLATYNRRLYNGNFVDLRLPNIAQDQLSVNVNWFKTAADFYAQFMFRKQPEITIEGNDRMNEIVQEFLCDFTPSWQFANTDMNVHGYGVITSHPDDPTCFVKFEPDYHYEVIDFYGDFIEDIFISIAGSQMDTERRANVIRYNIDGTSSWNQYDYTEGTLGNRIGSRDIPNRAPIRQTVFLPRNEDKTSLFRDMVKPLSEMVRTYNATSKAVRRNASPHLFGPDSMLTRDENGNYEIDEEGTFFPVPEEAAARPGYLQWDSKVDAVGWLRDNMWEEMLAAANLSPMFFKPDLQSGALSGAALERTVIPFMSQVNNYVQVNQRVIPDLLVVWNENRRVSGRENFSFRRSQVKVEFFTQEIFEDPETTGGRGPLIGRDTTSS